MEWKSFWEQIDPLTLENSSSICIIDETLALATPLLYLLLHRILKETLDKVFLLAFDQPLSQIIKTLRKLGIDLNLMAIKNRFWAIDALGPPIPGAKFECINLTEDDVEKAVYEFLQRIPNKDEKFTIIIDGISTLMSLGWTVIKLCRFIKLLEDAYPQGRIIIRFTKGMKDDVIITRWLIHRCQWQLLLLSLSSGLIREVHGELRSRSLATNHSDQSMLVKFTDTNVMASHKAHYDAAEFLK